MDALYKSTFTLLYFVIPAVQPLYSTSSYRPTSCERRERCHLSRIYLSTNLNVSGSSNGTFKSVVLLLVAASANPSTISFPLITI